MTPSFDVFNTPLQHGRMLIEASAGTGKTFSLTGIVLRLIAEENIPTDKLLVVTFTEAATIELKDRLYQTIASVLTHLRSGNASSNPLIEHFREKYFHSPENKQITAKLEEALEKFSKLAVFTIHGFCHRTLIENAFECSMLFDPEVVTDESLIRKEISNDFIRTLLINIGERTAYDMLRACKLNNPAALSNVISEEGKRTERKEAEQQQSVQESFKSLIETANLLSDRVRLCFRDNEETLRILFGLNTPLSGKTYRKPRLQRLNASIREICTVDESFRSIIDWHLHDTEHFSYLLPDKLTSSIKKSASFDRDLSAFSCIEELTDFLDNLKNSVREAFANWALPQLQERKTTKGYLSFDDMIHRLNDAINTSPNLLKKIQEKYHAGLIDEFQDTDSHQLNIFSNIFQCSRHRLYCVGDPKQSIYKFRGADIDTYLRFSNNPDLRKYALTKNFRSEASIVIGQNLLYEFKNNHPFGDSIEYLPVASHHASNQETPGIEFLYIGNSPLKQQAAKIAVEKAIRIISSQDEKKFSSIAFLVSDKREAALIGDILNDEAIPFTRRIDESVFKTNEAIQCYIALNGILSTRVNRSIKAAFATPLFDFDWDELANEKASKKLNATIENAVTINNVWVESGFLPAFMELLHSQNTRERLINSAAGEASLTNFLHLAELLSEREQASHISPESLLKWLGDRIKEESSLTPDNVKLREPTDADAAIISTIHSSKGLEYDHVIIPFAWTSLRSNTDQLEAARQMYVAVTRPKYSCTILSADKQSGTKEHIPSLLSILLNPSSDETIESRTLQLAEAHPTVFRFASSEASQIVELEHNFHPKELIPPKRKETDSISYERISSFSLLKSQKHELDLQNIEDFELTDSISNIEDSSIPSHNEDDLPKGAEMGNVLHNILEKIDFQSDNDYRKYIRESLEERGFSSKDYAAQIEEKLPIWLNTLISQDPPIYLRDISMQNRLAELEFHFPVKPQPLINSKSPIFSLQNYSFSQTLNTESLLKQSGFLKGFIDLVFQLNGKFYILDWKSNYLGPTISDYSKAAIIKSMRENMYDLQYLLYTVALDLYLESTLAEYDFEEHFGGVFYIYLRGFGEIPEHSVYFDKPSKDQISSLRSLFH